MSYLFKALLHEFNFEMMTNHLFMKYTICFKCSNSLFLSFIDSNKQTKSEDNDQVTAAQTWWSSHVASPLTSATHGVLQSHPTLSGRPRLSATTPRAPAASSPLRSSGSPGGFPSFANPNQKSPFRHLDYSSSATAELRRNPSLSAPDECARACRKFKMKNN
jgi:hypothetical protein